jgi:hypothetical protein
MVVLLVGGTIIGLIWADTNNLAGSIAVATNIVGVATRSIDESTAAPESS